MNTEQLKSAKVQSAYETGLRDNRYTLQLVPREVAE